MKNKTVFNMAEKATQVKFEFSADFETAGIPRFSGSATVTFPGEQSIDETQKKLNDFVFDKLIGHLQSHNAPKDVVLLADPAVTIIDSSNLELKIEASVR